MTCAAHTWYLVEYDTLKKEKKRVEWTEILVVFGAIFVFVFVRN